MKRILLSLSMIAFVGALAAGATGAFFSDTETSTGNTFTAGGLDLKIDSEQHYNGNICVPNPNGGDPAYVWQGTSPYPKPGSPCDGTWSETDLKDGVHKFFSFDDVKPGDWGENTVSFHVYGNDARGKFFMRWKVDSDGTMTEPEDEVALPAGDGSDGTPDGDLDSGMTFMAWLDQGMIPGFQCNNPGDTATAGARCPRDPHEGDNIWQQPHEPQLAMSAPVPDPAFVPDSNNPNFRPSFFDVFFDIATAMMSQTVGVDPICSPGDGHLAYDHCHGIAHDGRLVASVTYYIGWKWEVDPNLGNIAQTDTLGGDITFMAEQHRNNP